MPTLIALLQPLARALVTLHAPRHPLTPPHRLPTVDDCDGELDDPQADAERVSAASGWHDSSWELQRGLAIRECAMERLQRQVPLSWLLEA